MEYLTAGADMVLSKPLSLKSLQQILSFVFSNNNGPVVSRSNSQLMEYDNKLRWVPLRVITDIERSIDTIFA
jgi:hypothetical protein